MASGDKNSPPVGVIQTASRILVSQNEPNVSGTSKPQSYKIFVLPPSQLSSLGLTARTENGRVILTQQRPIEKETTASSSVNSPASTSFGNTTSSPRSCFSRRTSNRRLLPQFTKFWKSSLAENGYVRCPLRGCNFICLSFGEMTLHYYQCKGHPYISAFVCTPCNGRLKSEEDLKEHIFYTHSKESIASRSIPKVDEKIVKQEEKPKVWIRKRAYSKVHKISWNISLGEKGYVNCLFKNCYFLALDMEQMIKHYGICNGTSTTTPVQCPYCEACAESVEKLEAHIVKSHADRGIPQEFNPAFHSVVQNISESHASTSAKISVSNSQSSVKFHITSPIYSTNVKHPVLAKANVCSALSRTVIPSSEAESTQHVFTGNICDELANISSSDTQVHCLYSLYEDIEDRETMEPEYSFNAQSSYLHCSERNEPESAKCKMLSEEKKHFLQKVVRERSNSPQRSVPYAYSDLSLCSDVSDIQLVESTKLKAQPANKVLVVNPDVTVVQKLQGYVSQFRQNKPLTQEECTLLRHPVNITNQNDACSRYIIGDLLPETSECNAQLEESDKRYELFSDNEAEYPLEYTSPNTSTEVKSVNVDCEINLNSIDTAQLDDEQINISNSLVSENCANNSLVSYTDDIQEYIIPEIVEMPQYIVPSSVEFCEKSKGTDIKIQSMTFIKKTHSEVPVLKEEVPECSIPGRCKNENINLQYANLNIDKRKYSEIYPSNTASLNETELNDLSARQDCIQSVPTRDDMASISNVSTSESIHPLFADTSELEESFNDTSKTLLCDDPISSGHPSSSVTNVPEHNNFSNEFIIETKEKEIVTVQNIDICDMNIGSDMLTDPQLISEASDGRIPEDIVRKSRLSCTSHSGSLSALCEKEKSHKMKNENGERNQTLAQQLLEEINNIVPESQVQPLQLNEQKRMEEGHIAIDHSENVSGQVPTISLSESSLETNVVDHLHGTSASQIDGRTDASVENESTLGCPVANLNIADKHGNYNSLAQQLTQDTRNIKSDIGKQNAETSGNPNENQVHTVLYSSVQILGEENVNNLQEQQTATCVLSQFPEFPCEPSQAVSVLSSEKGISNVQPSNIETDVHQSSDNSRDNSKNKSYTHMISKISDMSIAKGHSYIQVPDKESYGDNYMTEQLAPDVSSSDVESNAQIVQLYHETDNNEIHSAEFINDSNQMNQKQLESGLSKQVLVTLIDQQGRKTLFVGPSGKKVSDAVVCAEQQLIVCEHFGTPELLTRVLPQDEIKTTSLGGQSDSNVSVEEVKATLLQSNLGCIGDGKDSIISSILSSDSTIPVSENNSVSMISVDESHDTPLKSQVPLHSVQLVVENLDNKSKTCGTQTIHTEYAIQQEDLANNISEAPTDHLASGEDTEKASSNTLCNFPKQGEITETMGGHSQESGVGNTVSSLLLNQDPSVSNDMQGYVTFESKEQKLQDKQFKTENSENLPTQNVASALLDSELSFENNLKLSGKLMLETSNDVQELSQQNVNLNIEGIDEDTEICGQLAKAEKIATTSSYHTDLIQFDTSNISYKSKELAYPKETTNLESEITDKESFNSQKVLLPVDSACEGFNLLDVVQSEMFNVHSGVKEQKEIVETIETKSQEMSSVEIAVDSTQKNNLVSTNVSTVKSCEGNLLCVKDHMFFKVGDNSASNTRENVTTEVQISDSLGDLNVCKKPHDEALKHIEDFTLEMMAEEADNYTQELKVRNTSSPVLFKKKLEQLNASSEITNTSENLPSPSHLQPDNKPEELVKEEKEIVNDDIACKNDSNTSYDRPIDKCLLEQNDDIDASGTLKEMQGIERNMPVKKIVNPSPSQNDLMSLELLSDVISSVAQSLPNQQESVQSKLGDNSLDFVRPNFLSNLSNDSDPSCQNDVKLLETASANISLEKFTSQKENDHYFTKEELKDTEICNSEKRKGKITSGSLDKNDLVSLEMLSNVISDVAENMCNKNSLQSKDQTEDLTKRIMESELTNPDSSLVIDLKSSLKQYSETSDQNHDLRNEYNSTHSEKIFQEQEGSKQNIEMETNASSQLYKEDVPLEMKNNVDSNVENVPVNNESTFDQPNIASKSSVSDPAFSQGVKPSATLLVDVNEDNYIPKEIGHFDCMNIEEMKKCEQGSMEKISIAPLDQEATEDEIMSSRHKTMTEISVPSLDQKEITKKKKKVGMEKSVIAPLNQKDIQEEKSGVDNIEEVSIIPSNLEIVGEDKDSGRDGIEEVPIIPPNHNIIGEDKKRGHIVEEASIDSLNQKKLIEEKNRYEDIEDVTIIPSQQETVEDENCECQSMEDLAILSSNQRKLCKEDEEIRYEGIEEIRIAPLNEEECVEEKTDEATFISLDSKEIQSTFEEKEGSGHCYVEDVTVVPCDQKKLMAKQERTQEKVENAITSSFDENEGEIKTKSKQKIQGEETISFCDKGKIDEIEKRRQRMDDFIPPPFHLKDIIEEKYSENDVPIDSVNQEKVIMEVGERGPVMEVDANVSTLNNTNDIQERKEAFVEDVTAVLDQKEVVEGKYKTGQESMKDAISVILDEVEVIKEKEKRNVEEDTPVVDPIISTVATDMLNNLVSNEDVFVPDHKEITQHVQVTEKAEESTTGIEASKFPLPLEGVPLIQIPDTDGSRSLVPLNCGLPDMKHHLRKEEANEKVFEKTGSSNHEKYKEISSAPPLQHCDLDSLELLSHVITTVTKCMPNRKQSTELKTDVSNDNIAVISNFTTQQRASGEVTSSRDVIESLEEYALTQQIVHIDAEQKIRDECTRGLEEKIKQIVPIPLSHEQEAKISVEIGSKEEENLQDLQDVTERSPENNVSKAMCHVTVSNFPMSDLQQSELHSTRNVVFNVSEETPIKKPECENEIKEKDTHEYEIIVDKTDGNVENIETMASLSTSNYHANKATDECEIKDGEKENGSRPITPKIVEVIQQDIVALPIDTNSEMKNLASSSSSHPIYEKVSESANSEKVIKELKTKFNYKFLVEQSSNYNFQGMKEEENSSDGRKMKTTPLENLKDAFAGEMDTSTQGYDIYKIDLKENISDDICAQERRLLSIHDDPVKTLETSNFVVDSPRTLDNEKKIYSIQDLQQILEGSDDSKPKLDGDEDKFEQIQGKPILENEGSEENIMPKINKYINVTQEPESELVFSSSEKNAELNSNSSSGRDKDEENLKKSVSMEDLEKNVSFAVGNNSNSKNQSLNIVSFSNLFNTDDKGHKNVFSEISESLESTSVPFLKKRRHSFDSSIIPKSEKSDFSNESFERPGKRRKRSCSYDITCNFPPKLRNLEVETMYQKKFENASGSSVLQSSLNLNTFSSITEESNFPTDISVNSQNLSSNSVKVAENGSPNSEEPDRICRGIKRRTEDVDNLHFESEVESKRTSNFDSTPKLSNQIFTSQEKHDKSNSRRKRKIVDSFSTDNIEKPVKRFRVSHKNILNDDSSSNSSEGSLNNFSEKLKTRRSQRSKLNNIIEVQEENSTSSDCDPEPLPAESNSANLSAKGDDQDNVNKNILSFDSEVSRLSEDSQYCEDSSVVETDNQSLNSELLDESVSTVGSIVSEETGDLPNVGQWEDDSNVVNKTAKRGGSGRGRRRGRGRGRGRGRRGGSKARQVTDNSCVNLSDKDNDQDDVNKDILPFDSDVSLMSEDSQYCEESSVVETDSQSSNSELLDESASIVGSIMSEEFGDLHNDSQWDDDSNDANKMAKRVGSGRGRRRGRGRRGGSNARQIRDDKTLGPVFHETEQINETLAEDDSEQVQCGKCAKEVSKKLYERHNIQIHNGLGWLEGEKPLELADKKAVMSIMWRVIKRHKKILVCETCGTRKKSAVGFYSHLQLCLRSVEEREALKVSCEVCGRVMLPVSLNVHMQSHRHSQMITDEPIETVRSKRAAATKATSLMQEVIKDETDVDEKKKDGKTDHNVGFYKRIGYRKPNFATIRKWKCTIASEGVVSCPFPGCTFKSSTLTEAMEHYSVCVKSTKRGFSCELCDFSCKIENKMKEHIASHVEAPDPDSDHDVQDPVKKQITSRSSCWKSCNKLSFLASETISSNNGDKPYLPTVKWTLKYWQENYSSNDLFPEHHSTGNDWIPLSDHEYQEYLPKTTESIPFSSVMIKDKIVNLETCEFSWRKMNIFESEIMDDVPTIFTGGPIWALAWSTVPILEKVNENSDQFLAVSCLRDMDDTHKSNNQYKGKGLIQLWNFGPLDNLESPSQSPKFVMGLAHDYGIAWDLEWCPSGCYETCAIERHLQRLGLLAAAFSDGCVHIFSMCFPSCLNSSERYPIFKCKPVISLVIAENPSVQLGNLPWNCLRVSWYKGKGHSVIAGGFTNGMVALWNVRNMSSLLVNKNEGTTKLSSYRSFQAHSSSITALSLAPQDEGRYLMTGSIDTAIKVWDVEDISGPIPPVLRKGMVTEGEWLTHWLSSITSFDDVYSMGHCNATLNPPRGYGFKVYPLLPQNSVAWSVSASDWINGIAQSSQAGELTTIFPHQLMINVDSEKGLKDKRILLSCVETRDILNGNKTDTCNTACSVPCKNHQLRKVKSKIKEINRRKSRSNEKIVFESETRKEEVMSGVSFVIERSSRKIKSCVVRPYLEKDEDQITDCEPDSRSNTPTGENSDDIKCISMLNQHEKKLLLNFKKELERLNVTSKLKISFPNHNNEKKKTNSNDTVQEYLMVVEAVKGDEVDEIPIQEKSLEQEEEINDCPSIEDMSDQYDAVRNRFGMIFCHFPTKNMAALPAESRKLSRRSEKMKTVSLEMYPITSLNKIKWNPNNRSFLWLASGYQCGVLQVPCVSGMHDDYVENILGKATKTVLQ